MIGRRLLLCFTGAAAIAPLSARAVAPPFPYVLIDPECGKPAFYLRREIKSGDLMLSADAATLDGGRMMPYSIPTCGSCGGVVRAHTRDIHATKAPRFTTVH